jgi:hypothetical protein
MTASEAKRQMAQTTIAATASAVRGAVHACQPNHADARAAKIHTTIRSMNRTRPRRIQLLASALGLSKLVATYRFYLEKLRCLSCEKPARGSPPKVALAAAPDL